MNIIYVAGGLNTRFDDLSIFPKILLPIKGNTSILEHNYNIFKKHKQYLIIYEPYYKMVKNFIEVNKLDITLIKSNNTNGSYNTIASVKHELPNGGLFFIWSDLIFDRDFIGDNIPLHSCMIYTRNGDYRFHVSHNGIFNVDNTNHGGNIPGIYYIEEQLIATVNIGNFDLIEHIKEKLAYSCCPLEAEIFEYRDKNIYITDQLTRPKLKRSSRHFNSLEFNDDIVTKKATKSEYCSLIHKEIIWYEKVSGLNISPRFIDKIIEYNFEPFEAPHVAGFKMQYMSGYVTLNEFWNTVVDEKLKEDALKEVQGRMTTLHQLEHKKMRLADVLTDVTEEFYHKVLERTKSVKDIIFNYDECHLQNYLNDALVHIVNYFIGNANSDGTINYYIIHGDLNGSNILIHPETLDVKFIDPRGYFGKTVGYGPMIYDYAKLNYFLYGYDNFNLNHYTYTDGMYDAPTIYRHNYFDSNIINIMTAIIYISLTSYICDNVMKVNIAYDHGMKLLKRFLMGY